MTNEFEQPSKFKQADQLNILGRIMDISKDDLAKFRDHLLPECRDDYGPGKASGEIIFLTLIFNLPDQTLREMVATQKSGKHLVAIHDIKYYLEKLSLITGDQKYIKFWEEVDV